MHEIFNPKDSNFAYTFCFCWAQGTLKKKTPKVLHGVSASVTALYSKGSWFLTPARALGFQFSDHFSHSKALHQLPSRCKYEKNYLLKKATGINMKSRYFSWELGITTYNQKIFYCLNTYLYNV